MAAYSPTFSAAWKKSRITVVSGYCLANQPAIQSDPSRSDQLGGGPLGLMSGNHRLKTLGDLPLVIQVGP